MATKKGGMQSSGERGECHYCVPGECGWLCRENLPHTVFLSQSGCFRVSQGAFAIFTAPNSVSAGLADKLPLTQAGRAWGGEQSWQHPWRAHHARHRSKPEGLHFNVTADSTRQRHRASTRIYLARCLRGRGQFYSCFCGGICHVTPAAQVAQPAWSPEQPR